LILAPAVRSSATLCTPSTSRIFLAMLVENGVPTTLETTNWDVSPRLTAASVLAVADWPSTAISETSVSPIISALAVAAVRRGLRKEFCAASVPTVPKARR
jgi:hypothetical protein